MKTGSLEIGDNQTLWYNIVSKDNSKGLCCFLHGIGDSKEVFSNLFETVHSQGYDLLYYDLPGFGVNKKIILEEFEDNIEIFLKLITLYSNPLKKNYCIGHSMGGLILLLAITKQKINVITQILTIEPSITIADLNFFKQVMEPPIGIGYLGLLSRVKNKGGTNNYSTRYYNNLLNSSPDAFKRYAKQIHDRFFEYQNLIFTSGIKFIYIYGNNSIGINERKKLLSFQNIHVQSFENAQHWVHIDAEDEFKTFIATKFSE